MVSAGPSGRAVFIRKIDAVDPFLCLVDCYINLTDSLGSQCLVQVTIISSSDCIAICHYKLHVPDSKDVLLDPDDVYGEPSQI